MNDPYSHESYEAWWRDHRGGSEDYSLADHFESQMRAIASAHFARRFGSLFECYDALSARYGPLLAAEAFRRTLSALAANR
jgi:hypothetical protein